MQFNMKLSAMALATALTVAKAFPLESRQTGTCKVATKNYCSPDNGQEWSWVNATEPIQCTSGNFDDASAGLLNPGNPCAVGNIWFSECSFSDGVNIHIELEPRAEFPGETNGLYISMIGPDAKMTFEENNDGYQVITGLQCRFP